MSAREPEVVDEPGVRAVEDVPMVPCPAVQKHEPHPWVGGSRSLPVALRCPGLTPAEQHEGAVEALARVLAVASGKTPDDWPEFDVQAVAVLAAGYTRGPTGASVGAGEVGRGMVAVPTMDLRFLLDIAERESWHGVSLRRLRAAVDAPEVPR